MTRLAAESRSGGIGRGRAAYRRHPGRHVVITHGGGRELDPLVDAAVKGDEATQAGILGVFAANVTDHRRRDRAVQALKQGFADPSPKARSSAVRAFQTLGTQHLSDHAMLLEAFADSATLDDHAGVALHLLEESRQPLPPVALDICERFVHLHGAAIGDISTSAAAEAMYVVHLVLRLHAQRDDPSIRRRCLDLVGQLVAIRAHGIDNDSHPGSVATCPVESPGRRGRCCPGRGTDGRRAGYAATTVMHRSRASSHLPERSLERVGSWYEGGGCRLRPRIGCRWSPASRGAWCGGKAGMTRFREEVLNVELARALERRGLDANAETIEGRGLPDVLIHLGGLKLVIEGRTSGQRKSLLKDAQARIRSGLADLSVGVLYPPDLSSADSMSSLTEKVEAANYSGSVFHLGQKGIDSQEFVDASLDQLAETIRVVFRLRVQNDVIKYQVNAVEAAIEKAVSGATVSNLFNASETLVARLSAALGLGPSRED
jgi:hypothetical protein